MVPKRGHFFPLVSRKIYIAIKSKHLIKPDDGVSISLMKNRFQRTTVQLFSTKRKLWRYFSSCHVYFAFFFYLLSLFLHFSLVTRGCSTKHDSELILRKRLCAMYYINEPLFVLEVRSWTFKGYSEKRVSVTVYRIDVLCCKCSWCKYKGLVSASEILSWDIANFFIVTATGSFILRNDSLVESLSRTLKILVMFV